MTLKRCCDCKTNVDVSLFGKNKWRNDGLQTVCKPCRKKRKDFKSWGGVVPKVDDLEGEIWKPVAEPGFEECYMISNFGRLKMISRVVEHANSGYVTKPETLKKPSLRGGYLMTRLQHRDYAKMCSIHRLIAQAFISNPENKPQVNHINGVKSDNRIENLEWVTNQENQIHAIKTGLKKLIGKPRLAEDAKRAIAAEFQSGVNREAIAKKFNISRGYVFLLGKTKNIV